jgi:hypothetical protein
MLAITGFAAAIAVGGYFWSKESPSAAPAQHVRPATTVPAPVVVEKVVQPAVVEQKVVVVEPKLEARPAAQDPLLTAYTTMDAELGRALADRGLAWQDLAAVAPNDGRQWGRWYKKEKIPSLEALTKTFESLKASVDRAGKAKTSTLAG